ncbi:MAG: tRNA1(Val) (adenine(37)-N6)-methyltransferase [Tissierellales bacterium]|nr:tRNA1(Val) (adenine(37)-N6)-methyltransferase [Tissierellales bacterium]
MGENNIQIDFVPGTGYKIFQNRQFFSFGVDAIILSNFAQPKGIVFDLGTGNAIIPLRIVNNSEVKKIYGIEIQKDVYELAKKSIEINQLIDKIELINEDINNLPQIFPKAIADTIITNPPYMKLGNALINTSINHAIARHEINLSLEKLIEISNYLLKPNGKFFMIHRPNRMVDVMYMMRYYNIEPKYLRMVKPKPSANPNLFLIEGLKGGNKELRVLYELSVYDEDGNYTKEMIEMYK